MATSIITIQSELDRARERLKGVEENIKKSIGRDINSGPPQISRPGFKRTVRQAENPSEAPLRPRFQNEGIKSRLGEFVRTVDRGEHDFRGRVNRRLPLGEPPSRQRKVEKPEERVAAKRRLGEQPAVTVFSRLSGPPKDDDFEDKESSVKITSQVIVQDAPSRKEVLAAQNGDNQSKARNRRMFGALLGTLQKFRQEENQLKEKEEKRAQVEKKLEEAALREKEELKKKRQELFSNRRQQQIEIRQLEFKLLRLKQLTEWESTKKHLLNFIQTKSTPKLFYLPKVHNEKTTQLLEESRKNIQKMMEEKRAEVERAIAEHVATKKQVKEEPDEEEVEMEEDAMIEGVPEEMAVEAEEDGEVREVYFAKDLGPVKTEDNGEAMDVEGVSEGVEVEERVVEEAEEGTVEEAVEAEEEEDEEGEGAVNGVSDKENSNSTSEEGVESESRKDCSTPPPPETLP